MIGASFGATGAAAGGLRACRRSKRRPATASVAARRSVHGGCESRTGAGASFRALGAATTAGSGAAARTVARGAVPVARDTITGRAGVPRSPAGFAEGRAPGRCARALEGKGAFVERVTAVRGRSDRRLADEGRATAAGAAPAGAVPRTASFGADASSGAGWTAAGAGCGTGVLVVGATTGGGAGWRGGSSVSGST